LKGPKGKRIIGFSFAWNGLIEAFKRERNFRIHLVVAVIVILISFYIQLTRIEWIFILFAIFIVLIAELINSLFERVIDYLNPAYHPHAKIIKDMAAGVVLLTACLSIIIGLLIFIPKIL